MFDEKAIKRVFVGYATSAKGYKIYNLEVEKVFLSWDVTFDGRSH